MDDKVQDKPSKLNVFSDMPSCFELTNITVSLLKAVRTHNAKPIYAASCCMWTMSRIIEGLIARGYGGAPIGINKLLESLPPGPNLQTEFEDEEDEDEYEDEYEDEDEDEDEDEEEEEEETIDWLKERFRQRRQWPRIALEAAASAYGIKHPLRLIAAAVNLPILRTDAVIGKSGSYEVWIAQPGWPEEDRTTKKSDHGRIRKWLEAKFQEKRNWVANEIYNAAKDDCVSEFEVWVISNKLPIHKEKIVGKDGLSSLVWKAIPGWPE